MSFFLQQKNMVMQDPPAKQDELVTLALWVPKACRAVSNYTVQSLLSPDRRVAATLEVERVCPHLHQENVTVEVKYPWSFIDALYFSMTVSTTIGYGHISPSLAAGRIMCMVYSLVGIPLTGMLLAWTSEFFGEQLFKLFRSKLDVQKQHSRGIIAMATGFYIIIGFVVFIFLPGAVFTTLEDWTYLESVYYAFITLTTIGFGDFVTGSQSEGATIYVYQICVILWIMIGLGYWVMVANFITKALKSKRLQSSMIRSAEEMKKLMQQMGIKQNDPTFLRQHSKATVNLMLQLSSIIAVQGGTTENGSSDTPSSPGSSSTEPSTSPLVSPMGIPGISALFGAGMVRKPPLSHLMGPMRKEFVMSHTSPDYTYTTYEQTLSLQDEMPVTKDVTTKDEVDLHHPTDDSKSSSFTLAFPLKLVDFPQKSKDSTKFTSEPKDSSAKPKNFPLRPKDLPLEQTNFSPKTKDSHLETTDFSLEPTDFPSAPNDSHIEPAMCHLPLQAQSETQVTLTLEKDAIS
ncbi:uncharacterized protein LOC121853167 isoform X2 [Homarus americanus]|uniref:uncharacterized protein LOC121853167 isoform X2 n=1 Tax=Homarus americanus TaxID=6706 RepID=UPI001C44CFBC|nr:uncharacterized protein LOC121853167 isoform X2 [Homarus americanus]